MHALDVLGDPVRRRILEVLAEGEHAAGEVVTVISHEFGISQPAVSQQLRVLRESGFARYASPEPAGSTPSRPSRSVRSTSGSSSSARSGVPRLDALGTELARGRCARRPTTTDQEEKP